VKAVPGGLLGIWCAVAMACAGSQPKASAAAPMGQDRSGEPHATIDALDRQIDDDLARAHVAPPAAAMCTGASCATAMSQPFATPAIGDAQCRPATTDKCTDACTLSTSICTNQQKICHLASQLAGDDWAANKCERARASCQAARDGCCSCVL
jgi:hypothetical protein